MNLKLVKSYSGLQFNVILVIVIYTYSISCMNNKKQPGLIYILQWTTSNQDWPYVFLEMGQEAFEKRNCTYQNCFLTNERLYFSDLLDFDVLLFNVIHLRKEKPDTPLIRSPSQLYVLVALEPASYNNIVHKYNWIFNMTWSYKLTADIMYPYILVKNERGEIIGLRKDMHWEYELKDMAAVDKKIMINLRYKSIAAAVIISNCNARSGRLNFITNLKKELLKYGQKVDVYGNCEIDALKCPKTPGAKKGLITNCAAKIQLDYYFYLAFENSFCEDYVSEKVLHGLKHFAVPVVYGGANYSSFMPDGIYLNARSLGVKRLAKEMDSIIRDPQRYNIFFKWHGYYAFHDTYGLEYHDTYSVCNICAKLNERVSSKLRTVYTFIDMWWNDFDDHI